MQKLKRNNDTKKIRIIQVTNIKNGKKQANLKTAIDHLRSLRYPSGLFAASNKRVKTGYDKAWIRDNIYTILGFEAIGDYATATATLHALFDIFLKHEYKIDYAIAEKPREKWQYIHARYHPETFDEFLEDWGNKQNDAIGAFLWKVGDLEQKKISVLRNENDRRIIQKLVDYLASIEYWHDTDNGMWEEKEEIHASSIGACLAGLIAVKNMVMIPSGLIEKGTRALEILLPRESPTKSVDLALLSLIYPYNIVNDFLKELILYRVETALVRQRGVIRYSGDQYYTEEQKEAEWTMGFAWLAIVHKQMGNTVKHNHYMKLLGEVQTMDGSLPELYPGGKSQHNENTPLAWAHSLQIVAGGKP